jgi:AcrR family transcriptional regulator
MPDGTPQPKKGRKFDQVLDGARQVFLSDGFEGASVDDIAKAAGVSKATLYSYFPDKRLLFIEVAKSQCSAQAETALATLDMEAPVPEFLRALATAMIAFITSDFGKRIFRIFVAETERFPELGRQFYESGTHLVQTSLVAYLRKAASRGEVVIDDYELAAQQFYHLCKVDIFERAIFNMAEEFSQAEEDRVIDGAIGMFLARYGA